MAQTVQVKPAPEFTLPGPVDSNSPAVWMGGNLVLFNAMGTPYRSEGPNRHSLANQTLVHIGYGYPAPVWIEATWLDSDGTLFGWYHYEPPGVCPGTGLTAPMIGALVSYDGGYSFQDLGIVLESGYPVDCAAQNGYFAGGNGDFSVVVDASKTYIYFLYDNYGGDVSHQGVAVARMEFSRRMTPNGAVFKYYGGSFSEPGIGGRVTPAIPANVSWMAENTDAFWGPSVHWNTAIKQYVMLLNHSCCSAGWPQEGIYISFNPDIRNATGWSQPLKIMDGSAGWYPQVLGSPPNGTDKVAGPESRLYVYGVSRWLLDITPAH